MTWLEQQQLAIYREWVRELEPFTISDLDDFEELKRKELEDEHMETYHEHVSRATRDAAEKFTADAIAAGKEFKPEGFREYPEDYFDATELQDSDSYRDFVNAER